MKVVFLHGLGQKADDWQNVIKALPGQVQNIDCPELFLLPSSAKTYTDILAALENRYAAEKERLLLCGLSLGAVLALDYATRHRDKVVGLILIAAQYKTTRLLMAVQNLLFQIMIESAFADSGLSKDEVIALCRSMSKVNLRGSLNQVDCPVLLLCGEKDGANKAASRKLQKLLPQAELYLVPKAGHEVNRDVPQEVAAAVEQLQGKIEIARSESVPS